MSMARATAALWSSFMCVWMLSMSWSSMVKTGFSEVIGSWKIIEMWLPRMSRMSLAESASRSCPL